MKKGDIQAGRESSNGWFSQSAGWAMTMITLRPRRCLATLVVLMALTSSVTDSAATIVQQAFFENPAPRSYGQFGYSTAISGNTAVVGSAGEAYVYVREGTNWILQASLNGSNTQSSDWFGCSVAISGDTIVVGANSERTIYSDNTVNTTGAAYIFVRHGTTWTQQAHLKASDTTRAFPSAHDPGDLFGFSVAVSGDTVVVGAPWEESNATGINGNPGNNTARASGAAYVFVRNGTNWNPQAYLKASNAAEGDQFGFSVAVSGQTIVVGAIREDSSAQGINGNQNSNGLPDSGAAYVFVRAGTNWTQQAYLKASNTRPGDNFGWAVTISGDTVAVGAPEGFGTAYVFVRNGATWNQQSLLQASNPALDARFGISVSLAGETLVVGAHWEGPGAPGRGAAYVFVRNASTWTQQAYLKPSNGQWYSIFGWAVAISGDTVIVGDLAHDNVANGFFPDSGAAYIYAGLGPPPPDSDGDGVPDPRDQCPGTAPNAVVDANGCSADQRDADNDRVPDSLDQCPGTAPGAIVDARGCSAEQRDSDGDGVRDNVDQCPGTAPNAIVDASGCSADQRDSDNDGVSDSLDQCPGTAPNAVVDVHGCSAQQRDSDGDGVPENVDQCPNTPAGVITDATGCSIEQLVPCDGPWRNHGQYLRALHDVTSYFLAQGLINKKQAIEIFHQGANSNCGKK